MNRRTLITASAVIPFLPNVLAAQGTPETTPASGDVIDKRARRIVSAMKRKLPADILTLLETTAVSNDLLVAAAAPDVPTPVAWADMGDTDLFSSLGGVVISKGDGVINGDLEMLGGYIVYESVDIAYAELVRKLGDLYDQPQMTTAVGGTNFWVLGEEGFSISVGRIGYVIILGYADGTTEGLIDHLADVIDA
ncbi:MAG: hypothetical protein KC435_00035 [Thermomicrobiales bacterium]|nr:hypothetical protein [Thermomicrobiales bacterium]